MGLGDLLRQLPPGANLGALIKQHPQLLMMLAQAQQQQQQQGQGQRVPPTTSGVRG